MEDENLNMEENDSIKEPKKKGSIGIIILMIILMIGCLVGGYFLNESGLFSKDKKTTEEKNKKEKDKDPVITNYDVTDEKVASLLPNILKGSYGFGGCYALETFANDRRVDVDDLSSLVIYHVVEKNEFYQKKDSFTLDEFNAAIKKYFADGYIFDANSIDYKGSTCPQFNYDSSTKTFTKQETACGGTCGPVTSYKLIKAVDTDGTLVLTTKVIFAADYVNPSDYDYYSNYQKTNGIGKLEDDINTLYDKGTDYKFTFKLVDGYYAFVSSEQVK